MEVFSSERVSADLEEHPYQRNSEDQQVQQGPVSIQRGLEMTKYHWSLMVSVLC